ncbi:nitrate/nitrite transport system substrate-binding protein [Pseudoduganella lurida]|uniref:Nitrate/nitrite transport system substrate-binding protein n=1 Tax=Pseudoduganella lurida TaxID=1036180 RepID=A0A562RAK6_9BURK|nr:CmpA/NrtA family ABC transporter substrate-binding protein [Pseudoduganella lurida]TWI66085.1 nitrate/nitrite transport system substrate-binding protein [Pseudoduganella lurida]
MQIEKPTVNIGFNPLTDCASVVMAALLGFDEKHGIRIVLSRETSWAAVRDKLLNGELDAAHALYGMVYGVQLGIGTQPRDMAVLMNLNRNGQAITLSRRLAEAGATDGASLAALMQREPRQYVFAQTFPTGTHAMWLYYWLAAHGIHPLQDVSAITLPPSQMVYNLTEGHMDGFCAGDPWGHRAVVDGVGITAATSQQIWPDHPEKVLGASLDFVRNHPNTCRALIAAVLEAGRWIDASVENRRATAEILSATAYVNTDKAAILPRILGRYEDGMAHAWQDEHPLCFHQDGAANYPWLSDGMWFLTQFRRWGLLKDDPDYLAVAQGVTQVQLYREAAELAGVPVPAGQLRTSTLIDGRTWDGRDPAGYAAAFPIHQR